MKWEGNMKTREIYDMHRNYFRALSNITMFKRADELSENAVYEAMWADAVFSSMREMEGGEELIRGKEASMFAGEFARIRRGLADGNRPYREGMDLSWLLDLRKVKKPRDMYATSKQGDRKAFRGFILQIVTVVGCLLACAFLKFLPFFVVMCIFVSAWLWIYVKYDRKMWVWARKRRNLIWLDDMQNCGGFAFRPEFGQLRELLDMTEKERRFDDYYALLVKIELMHRGNAETMLATLREIKEEYKKLP